MKKFLLLLCAAVFVSAPCFADTDSDMVDDLKQRIEVIRDEAARAKTTEQKLSLEGVKKLFYLDGADQSALHFYEMFFQMIKSSKGYPFQFGPVPSDYPEREADPNGRLYAQTIPREKWLGIATLVLSVDNFSTMAPDSFF